jgi:hypothetical protein
MRAKIFYVAQKKRIFGGGLAVLLLILAAFTGVRAFAGEKTAPEEMLAQALKKTLAAGSFRFRVEIKKEGGETLSQVEGEWVSPGQVHLKGDMFKTPVEFIKKGETVYLKDIFSEKWLAFHGNQLGRVEQCVLELSPLSLVQFKSLAGVRYAGREKLDREKTVVLECRPLFLEPALNEKYGNCRCRVWVAVRDGRVRQLALEPAEQNSNLPLLILGFWAYDQPAAIVTPEKVED